MIIRLMGNTAAVAFHPSKYARNFKSYAQVHLASGKVEAFVINSD